MGKSSRVDNLLDGGSKKKQKSGAPAADPGPSVSGRQASATSRGTASQITVHVPSAAEPPSTCACYFPSGQAPEHGQYTLYEQVQGNARRATPFTLIGSQEHIKWVGRTHGEDYAPGGQPCSYAVGVFDADAGTLSLLPVCGGRILRMEPRLPGLQYGLDSITPLDLGDEEADTREERLAQNKKLVDSFGSTRRRRQLTARELGVVKADKLGDAADALSSMLGRVASEAVAQGLTKDKVLAAATETRLLPPHCLDAHTAEAAYPVAQLIPPDVMSCLRTGRLLAAAESADAFEELRKAHLVHEVVLGRMSLLKTELNADQRRKTATLMGYLSALLKLKSMRPAIVVDLQRDGLEQMSRNLKFSPGLLEALLGLFYHSSTEGNVTRYSLSKEAEVRLVAYICVASLLLEPAATVLPSQFLALAEALKMQSDQLVARFKEVGANCTFVHAKAQAGSDAAADGAATPAKGYSCCLLPDSTKTLAEVLPGIKLKRTKR